MLRDAAQAGRIGPTMLRRLLTIRNWPPETDRADIDAIVRLSRIKGIECAPSSEAAVRDVIVSAIDGFGAQSRFAIVRDGRRQAILSVLTKVDIGVCDAWVNPGRTKRNPEKFLAQLEDQVDNFESSMDFLCRALAHSLAEAVRTATPPPFWPVDVVERLGLPTINLEILPSADLIGKLVAGIPLDRQTSDSVDRAVRNSLAWDGDFAFFDSRFEDDDAVDGLIGGKRRPAKNQIALMVDEYLPRRREHWARLLAWTAAALPEDKAPSRTTGSTLRLSPAKFSADAT